MRKSVLFLILVLLLAFTGLAMGGDRDNRQLIQPFYYEMGLLDARDSFTYPIITLYSNPAAIWTCVALGDTVTFTVYYNEGGTLYSVADKCAPGEVVNSDRYGNMPADSIKIDPRSTSAVGKIRGRCRLP